MLNFLPQKNKRQIIFEYLLRVAVLLFVFIFASSIIINSLFFPSFFFVKYKNQAINGQLEITKQKNLSKGEDVVSLIKNVNKLSIILSNSSTIQTTYEDVVNKIISLKNKNIKISSITIVPDGTNGGKKVSLNGIAKTRDSLTLFENEIKTDGFFRTVLFPVSNFIQSANANFSVTLIQ